MRVQDGPAWARGPWLPVLLLLIAVVARAQTFGNPVIEFDEQFYRVVGERMLHGAVPYLDIWDRKPIGLFLVYAFAALVGGEQALSYQILATLTVALTAWTIHAMARRLCTVWKGPLLAATLYILWLDLLQGEGGQASVFYTLPVCAAALLALRQHLGERPGAARLLLDGTLALLLIGLAAQLKYTVFAEGAYLALLLLGAGWRQRIDVVRLAGMAMPWAFAALLPSLLAWAVYAGMGHGEDWLFANITSILLRTPMPLLDMAGDLVGSLAIMALLVAAAIVGWRQERGTPAATFVVGWATVTLVAIFAMRSFVPHYWIPLAPPLALLAAPALERMRRFAIATVAIAALAGQILVGFFIHSKGDADTVAHMIAAIGPVPNCLYVFDGFPALYAETKSCLPSRFLFPGHLNGIMEATSLGTDPVAEVTRIMALRPDAVVIDEPVWSLQNPQTAAIVTRTLAAHYDRVLVEPTGAGRWRLVYRVKPASAHR